MVSSFRKLSSFNYSSLVSFSTLRLLHKRSATLCNHCVTLWWLSRSTNVAACLFFYFHFSFSFFFFSVISCKLVLLFSSIFILLCFFPLLSLFFSCFLLFLLLSLFHQSVLCLLFSLLHQSVIWPSIAQRPKSIHSFLSLWLVMVSFVTICLYVCLGA